MEVLNDKRRVILTLDTLPCKLQNSKKKAKMLSDIILLLKNLRICSSVYG